MVGGNNIAQSIPVEVNNSTPLHGLPPNCFTEHANLRWVNLSEYIELSFFSRLRHI